MAGKVSYINNTANVPDTWCLKWQNIYSWALDVACSFHVLQLAPSPFSLGFVNFGLKNSSAAW